MELVFEWKSFSNKLQKVINAIQAPPRRPVVTGSHRALFAHLVKMWEEGTLTFGRGNTFESVGDFIFRNYDVRHEGNPEKPMKRTSIITDTYKYRNL